MTDNTQQSGVERVAPIVAGRCKHHHVAERLIGPRITKGVTTRFSVYQFFIEPIPPQPKVSEAEVRAMMEDLRLYLDADDHILEAHAKRILDRLNQADSPNGEK